MQSVGVLKERNERETRVTMVPAVVTALVKSLGLKVLLEPGAGLRAGFSDNDYLSAGAELAHDAIKRANIILAINACDVLPAELGSKTLIGLCDPYVNQPRMTAFKDAGASVLALELIPRISRAQSMDVLSSQANIAGYVAVLNAANRLGKVMPLLMTAAGTIKPAKVLILGAGVAGLQAIATAKRLGALVFAYDLRSVVKEQVESLGAKFVDISIAESGEGSGGYAKALSEQAAAEQRARLTDFAKDFDIIICTAQIPGRKAPRLLDDHIFPNLRDGSIIIDMAAQSGGNVAGSVVDVWKKVDHAWLYGADSLARQVPKDASFTFSKNIYALLELLAPTKHALDLKDEILAEALVCHQQAWVNKKLEATYE